MPQRIVDLYGGVVMVVTDLHGDWPLYERYRDVFLHLYERGLVNTWVVCGDYIHSNGPEDQDGSLNIVLDLIALQKQYGNAVIVLLGNHEMPHIYSITLQRGHHLYTPRFERVMGAHRREILAFFDDAPLFVRTRAGLSLCHAGAFPEIARPDVLPVLAGFSHQDLLRQAQTRLESMGREHFRSHIETQLGQKYGSFVLDYFDVHSPEDPGYDAYLAGQVVSNMPDFDLLWAALFSRNEYAHDMGTYTEEVRALLRELSQDGYVQKALVCGHIGCRDGAQVIAEGQQLRLASGIHAYPYTSARYLLFDAAKPLSNAASLLEGLGSVFDL